MIHIQPHLSLKMFYCSSLLYRERVPLNCLPCHYMITLKSWTSNCNLPSGEDSLLLLYWLGVWYFLLNVEIWPYLCLHYVCVSVCVLKEKARFSDAQQKEGWCPRVSHRGQLSPPPKPVPQTIILLLAKQNLTLWSCSFFVSFLFVLF